MKTPFYEKHKSLNARIVDFHGWLMPLQYSGIISEHTSVRTRAGLFDVSHMGRFEIKGANSLDLLQNLMTNDISTLQQNQALYSLMCYDTGGIVDDLIVYRIDTETYLLVVNSSNIHKDFEWILEHQEKVDSTIKIKDITDSMALLALQGPLAYKLLQWIAVDANFGQLKPFNLIKTKLFGVECIVSRTGYTGEDGFELFFDSAEAQLWDKLLQVDAGLDIRPAGLGARDSLRLEAGLFLYGNDMDEHITPLEVPLTWTVKFDKNHDFIGKKALQARSVTRKLVGFEMLSKRIARNGNEVLMAGSKIGSVTSGGYSPTLNKSIGFCFVPSYVPLGQIVDIRITRAGIKEAERALEGVSAPAGADKENLYPARITSTRFYKRNKKHD
ncbi:MAG TPA: glycine cleavage system aminomethyltransferase GcvT [Candidatus Nitrosopolaris sp.]|nr:glycine cleavage system aminomethyltransferase GcvT [Candidatus Nitrosopolaris sp.]